MIDKNGRARRSFVSAVVGAIVFVLCVLSALPTFVYFRSGEQGATLFMLREIDRAIESFGIAFKKSARTVDDLRSVHPYLFENPESRFTMVGIVLFISNSMGHASWQPRTVATASLEVLALMPTYRAIDMTLPTIGRP